MQTGAVDAFSSWCQSERRHLHSTFPAHYPNLSTTTGKREKKRKSRKRRIKRHFMSDFRLFFPQVLQEKTDQICEMASIMQNSIQLDEDCAARDNEVRTRLVTENKVSCHFMAHYLLPSTFIEPLKDVKTLDMSMCSMRLPFHPLFQKQ